MPSAALRIGLTTLGCKVNQYDTATIADRLSAAGHRLVPFADPADVYIVNSCTVTNQADAESRQLARRAKRRNPAARIIMTGCYAQVAPQAIARLPEVDYVIGINRLDDILRAVTAELREAVAVSNVRKASHIETFGTRTLHDDDDHSIRKRSSFTFQEQTRAFLKIQEGCDLFCTFCIVPMSRGKSRSISPRRVLEQLDLLAEQGFQEVVLTGVHLGGYGADLDTQVDLTWLVAAIEERKPVPRVRLSSLDPHEFSPALIDLLAEAQTVCPHLHIPLQSGDDHVLARMRRRYDRTLAGDVLARLRDALPQAALGTDLIVGFPGEGEHEFDQGYRFLEDSPFTYFHVFPYSVRSGTTAAKFSDSVPKPTITRRARQVRQLGARKKAAFAARFVGHTVPVLFEHSRDKTTGLLKGYSRNYLRVLAAGGDECMNRELPVRLSHLSTDSLRGTIVPPDAQQPSREP